MDGDAEVVRMDSVQGHHRCAGEVEAGRTGIADGEGTTDAAGFDIGITEVRMISAAGGGIAIEDGSAVAFDGDLGFF